MIPARIYTTLESRGNKEMSIRGQLIIWQQEAEPTRHFEMAVVFEPGCWGSSPSKGSSGWREHISTYFCCWTVHLSREAFKKLHSNLGVCQHFSAQTLILLWGRALLRAAWCCTCRGVAWRGTAWCGTVLRGAASMAWHSVVWHNAVRCSRNAGWHGRGSSTPHSARKDKVAPDVEEEFSTTSN